MKKYKIKQSLGNAGKALWNSLPTLIGVILLVSLVFAAIPKSAYSAVFTKNYFIDSLIGSVLGSILAGNPITSYVLAGELLSQGVSLIAVTSFIVAWVTVGIVQLPAESILLGKKFAITRNATAFLFSIVVAVITVLGVSLL